MRLQRATYSEPLHILIVADRIADAERCKKELTRTGLQFLDRRVATRVEFESALENFSPGLIISEVTLADGFDGLTALDLARTRFPEIPFVFISNAIGKLRVSEKMTHDTHFPTDHVLKNRLTRLGPVVQRIRQQVTRPERAQTAVQISGLLYRSMFEGAAEGILLCTLDGILLAANPAAARMLGYDSPEEMISESNRSSNHFHVEPRARRWFVERVKRDGEMRGYETCGARKDGTPLWVSLSGRLVLDEESGVNRFLTIIADISERKRLEGDRAQLAAIVENSTDAIISRGLDRRILTWNNAAARLFGWTAEEAIGQSILLIVPPERTGENAERRIQVEQGIRVPSYDTVRLVKDGRRVDVSLSQSPITNERDEVIAVSLMFRDISDQRRSQDDLERLAAIVESSNDAIISRALDRTILTWNPAAEKLFGWTAEEAIGKSVSIFIPPERAEESDHNQQHVHTGQSIPAYDTVRRTKDGRLIDVSLTHSPIMNNYGETIAVSLIFRDISERQRQQREIDRLSRIQALSSAINAAIVRSTSRPDLLDNACRTAVEHGGFGIAWVGTLDANTLEITPVSSAGPDAGKLIRASEASGRPDHPSGQGVAGRAVRERRAVYSNDIAAEPGPPRATKSEAIRLGYLSRIALPLLVDDKVVGIIVLYAPGKDFFNEEDVRLLTELAGNVSFGLEYIARQHRIEKLSRLRAVSSEINTAIVRSRTRQFLFNEACRIAVEHGRFGIAWIGKLDPERLEVTPTASAGLGENDVLMHSTLVFSRDIGNRSLVAVAVRERRPVYSNDITTDADSGGERRKEAIRRGYRSAIVLPLIAEGIVTGTFSMFVKETNFFDDEETGLLTELASNLSFALDHLARQEKLDKLSRVRAISSSINAAIARVRERGALLAEICRIAAEQGKFEMIWIGTLDHKNRRVQPIAWTGFSPETANAVTWENISSTRGTLSEAVRTLKPAVRDDIESQLPTGLLRQAALDRGCRSTVCLPLVVDGEVTALISLFVSGRGFFDQDELTILNEVAPNISFALESILRQERFERLSHIRAVLGEINAAIVRTRDRQKLFEEACRIAIEAGGLKFAWIGLVERDPLQIRPTAWAGVEDRVLTDRQTGLPVDEHEPGGPGPFAEAVIQRKIVVVNDVHSDSRISRKQDHLARNIHSIAILPLLVEGEAVGIMGLHARETGFFDEEEVKLLSEMSGDIALALQTIAKQAELDYLSYYDPLTGLPNRTLFIDRTGQQMRARGGEPRMVALILLNIERFRNINETFGRHGGDELLKLVARRLENAFNGKDYLARVGADGLGVVVRGIKETTDVLHIIENQMFACFREPYLLNGEELRVSARAGIAMYPADGVEPDILFRNAEAALKKARDSSEHFLFYAADMNARAAHVLSLETRLRKAVEAEEFLLHYQPKVDLANDEICGLEALIRWREPGGNLVAPGSFIPVLEETGLILEVGKWALTRALAEHRQWAARGLKVPRIAVNVSAIQLQNKDFSDMVINAVHEQGGNAESLELEVTESLLMKDVEASIRKLSHLRGLGIHIAMDDFGTGYSSLSYLARLPINLVKIDRSFVNSMTNNPQDMSIVTTIIALAHSLNLRVVAEGVETEGQSRLLKLLKCDEAQGFLFSKPLPAIEIEPLLRALV